MLAARLSHCLGIEAVNPKTFNYIGRDSFPSPLRFVWLPELCVRLLLALWIKRPPCLVLNDLGALLAWSAIRFVSPDIPRIVFIHHGLFSQGSGHFLRWKNVVARRMLESGRVISVFVSHYILHRICAEVFVTGMPPRARVMHIPVPIRSADRVVNIRKRFLMADQIVIGLFTRINEKKVPLTSLGLIARLSCSLNKPIEIHLYGTGESDHLKRIDELVKRLQMQGQRVSVSIKGLISETEVPSAIKRCHLIANFSLLQEACPTIALEAAQLGMPYLYMGGNGNDELQVYLREASVGVSDLCDPEESRRVALSLKKWSESAVEIQAEEVSTVEEYLTGLLHDSAH